VYRSSDGLFVNMALVREGYAAALTIRPNVAHADDLAAAAAQARESKTGLWGRCGGPDKALTGPRAPAR
jgi:micrococcal nuclease